MKTIEQAAFECAQKLDCPNLNIGHAAIIAAAMHEVCASAVRDWNDIEPIMAERNQLRAERDELAADPTFINNTKLRVALDVAEAALNDIAVSPGTINHFHAGNTAAQALARITEARK